MHYYLTTTMLSSLTALLVLALTAHPATAQVKKNRGTEIASYTKQLTARFNSWDLNRDKVLDTKELAIAFRGLNAKPYDAGQNNTPAALTTNFDRGYLKMLGRLTIYTARFKTPINYALADTLYRDWSSKKTVNPATYKNYPDYQFVLLAGTTGLPKLTKQEFDAWASQYANMLADVEDGKRNVKAAQVKLQKAKKAADKQRVMMEVAQRQQALTAAVSALQTIPTIIQQKLAVKR